LLKNCYTCKKQGSFNGVAWFIPAT